MEIESMKADHIFLENKHLPDALLHTFDLHALVEKMKRNPMWLKGELNTMVLLKNPAKQIILTTLHAGTRINSFQSNNSITFQIIDGRLKFHAHKKVVALSKGQVLTLQEKIKYSLTTEEYAVLLLTIENGVKHLAVN